MTRRTAAAVGAACVALALLFFWRLAFTDLILARGDTYAYFTPYWHVRNAAIMAGEVPLWSPDLFAGVPLLANSQVGVLYPPNWIVAPLDAPVAIKVSVLLHVMWATLGAYVLARRAVGLTPLPALLAGALFGLGGYAGAHVEQINQLQGLSWLPWLFATYHAVLMAERRRFRWMLLLGMVWAMQLFCGHTQTAFISGVGLGVYGLLFAAAGARRLRSRATVRAGLRAMLPLVAAVIVAIGLALPQLIPTQELVSQSNRGDGLTAREAVAFSWEPALIGRSLLPSYDAQPFSEYVTYTGVIGLGLALLGAIRSPAGEAFGRRRIVWVGMAALGIFLALGVANPAYFGVLARLPGFNLFRVPSRWLALFALAAALLAGMGAQTLLRGPVPLSARRTLAGVIGILVALMAAAFLAGEAADEVTGDALPSALTIGMWALALAILLAALLWQGRISGRVRVGVLAGLALAELWLASGTLPYNDAVSPAVYDEGRYTTYLMQTLSEQTVPPGRYLSISNLLFDPGDEAALLARWARDGLDERAIAHAMNAVKMREVLAANLNLIWDVPSFDGFDGGVLPTANYTAFSALLLPQGSLRTTDGRLREWLARPECRGVCTPDDRWLDLAGVRYLIVDKVYDLNHDGVFFDTTFTTPLAAGEAQTYPVARPFVADGLHLLLDCEGTCGPVAVEFVYADGARAALAVDAAGEDEQVGGFDLLRLMADEARAPVEVRVTSDAPADVIALSLVDGRTGDFVELTPPGWQRVHSADVKVYENLDVLPRAFVVHDVVQEPDTWDGREAALTQMMAPEFDPAETAVLNAGNVIPLEGISPGRESLVEIVSYSATEIVLDVDAAAPGYLVLTDAWYPGWRAELAAGDTLDVYKADVMFRAVPVEAGQQTITFSYRPWWYPWLLYAGAICWLAAIGVAVWQFRSAFVTAKT